MEYDDFEHELACFEEWLFRDLDGWFCADIACCDNCYSDYLNTWPYAYKAEGAKFQCDSIDIKAFYSGSRLQEAFTEERFFQLMKHIPCPNCNGQIMHNLYPYELPFEVIDGFKGFMDEIKVIANETPFLILEHQFAKTVFTKIKTIANKTLPSTYPNMYRARVAETLNSREHGEFCFPPLEFAYVGRYNHAGKPALYLGDSEETCFHEVREKECVIAEINIGRQLKILDLVDPYKAHTEDENFLNTLMYSALLSAPQEGGGQNKPEYIFSRFLADCARSAGFDGIKYFSTRPAMNSFNIVLFADDLRIGNECRVIKIFDYCS